MSGNVIEIPQSKRLAPIWVQQLRVAAYCRVSTGHEEQQNSLKNQIEFYTEYIQRNPYWRFVSVYYDTASGLRKNHRPGYQQLLKDCRRKKIDLILVKSLSRFGRDTVETIKQIRRLKRMNIGVYIETGGINTLTTSDRIIDQLAALDQAESQSRSENIKFGIRHRMRSGKTLLNHTRFLGYTKGPDGVLQIVPEEAEIVRTIFDLYVQGNGVRKIKKYLGVPWHQDGHWQIRVEYLHHRPDAEQREVCRPGFDAEDLRAGFSDGQKRKEPWAVGDVPGGERP